MSLVSHIPPNTQYEYDQWLLYRNAEDIARICEKIIKGSVLTLNLREGRAYLDYWVPPDRPAQEIPYAYAQALVAMGFVGHESGNLETTEQHYTFADRERIRIDKLYKR